MLLLLLGLAFVGRALKSSLGCKSNEIVFIFIPKRGIANLLKTFAEDKLIIFIFFCLDTASEDSK